mmetsp:Transcript_68364/g.113645  ORF Transcript_68364/g.113645 Transcript_68364/m.113645 type:complete len:216 (+) Transcript_68364:37-684(+)
MNEDDCDECFDCTELEQILEKLDPAAIALPEMQANAHIEGLFLTTLLRQLQDMNYFFMKRTQALVKRLQPLSTGKLVAQPNSSLAQMPASCSADHVAQHIAVCATFDHLRKSCVFNMLVVMKVLNKHDSLSMLQLRSPFIRMLLKQPFASVQALIKIHTGIQKSLHRLSPPMGCNPKESGSTCSKCGEALLMGVAVRGRQVDSSRRQRLDPGGQP